MSQMVATYILPISNRRRKPGKIDRQHLHRAVLKRVRMEKCVALLFDIIHRALLLCTLLAKYSLDINGHEPTLMFTIDIQSV